MDIRAKNHSEIKFEDLWLRRSGFSLFFWKLQRLEHLSITERLFAAILSGDKERSREIITSAETLTMVAFIELVRKHRFARLTLDNLCEMNVLQNLDESQRNELSLVATQETACQNRSDKNFKNVLSLVANLVDSLVWIKGVSLCRTVYALPVHRQCGDFDVVVKADKFATLVETLESAGFTCVYDPGFCNQLEVGPILPHSALTLSPAPGLIPSSLCSIQYQDTMIDIKIGPLDRGLQMHEIDRFFSDSSNRVFLGECFRSPSLVDHLVICVHTLQKDRFQGWKTLFDVHLLSGKLSKEEQMWDIFVSRCKLEGLEEAAWVSLSLAADRFATVVPQVVLTALTPRRSLAFIGMTFTASPYFVWNATGLPMLLLNAATSSDRHRKLQALGAACFPNRAFICGYFNNGKLMSPIFHAVCMVLHWLVLLLPGGVIRNSFGKIIWPAPKHEHVPVVPPGSGPPLQKIRERI